MRTPGRCTNHEACWLANGNRDIWVSVADEFACPVCRTPLQAPPMTAITHRGFGAAMGTSLALMLIAGTLGFGLVQALRGVAGAPAPSRTAQILPAGTPGGVLGVRRPHPRQAVPTPDAVPAFAAPAAAPLPGVTAPTVAPPVQVVIGQVALQSPVPRMVTLPVAAPGPMGPEEFTDNGDAGGSARWRHHVAPAARAGRSYFLPAPGWHDNTDDADAINRADIPYSVAQGDGEADDSSHQVAASLLAQSDRPTAAAPAGPVAQQDMAPPVTTTLTVPAAVRLRMPADQPAERVDPTAAAIIDGARNAPARLESLPLPPPDKLAVPAYPQVAAEDDRPGRVAVGCTISVRGEPTNCQVRAHAGGTSFVGSVLDWLHSGAVRYKPHFVQGTAVPESRLYKVKFEP